MTTSYSHDSSKHLQMYEVEEKLTSKDGVLMRHTTHNYDSQEFQTGDGMKNINDIKIRLNCLYLLIYF